MTGLKQSIQTMLPAWKGKLLAHVMGWFGEGTPAKVHRVNRYLSNDPAVVEAQLNAMQNLGIEGIIVTWQGPTVNPFLHASTLALWEGCMEHQMLFALLLDPWVAEGQPNPTLAAVAALQSTDCQRMLASPCYLPERFILEFDLAHSAGVNVTTLQAATPATPLLSWHTGFSWPNAPLNPQSPTDALAFLKRDNLTPTMRIPGVNLAFNNGGSPLPPGVSAPSFMGLRNYMASVWGPSSAVAVIDHQAGNWFYDQLEVTPATAPYIALVTWNDSDEQSGIEHFAAMLMGTRIGK